MNFLANVAALGTFVAGLTINAVFFPWASDWITSMGLTGFALYGSWAALVTWVLVSLFISPIVVATGLNDQG